MITSILMCFFVYVLWLNAELTPLNGVFTCYNLLEIIKFFGWGRMLLTIGDTIIILIVPLCERYKRSQKTILLQHYELFLRL